MMCECIPSSWLLDTGASYHVTGNCHMFVDIVSIPACPVGLTHGERIVATQSGSVTLAGGLTPYNIIIVTGLQCHLIFVS